MAQTPRRPGAAALAGLSSFGAGRRAFRLLRIASWLAALLVACTPESDAAPIPDERRTEAASDETPATDVTTARDLLHDAGSPRSYGPRDNESPPRDRGEEPDSDGSSGGGSASADAPASDGGLASDGSADAASSSLGEGSGSDGRSTEVAACYSQLSRSHPAVRRQREVFARGDYAARPGLIEELAEAAAAYPDEEQFALLVGLMRLWRIVEPDGFEAIDLLELLDMMGKSEQDLQRAYELCPTDHRIAGWLGPLWILWGRAIGDTEKLEAGVAVLRRGAEQYPDFVTFTQLVADSVVPASEPDFQRALDAIGYYRDRCGGTFVEPACLNGPSTAHSSEAMALYFGDTLAKARDREGALAWYTGAMQAPAWSSWLFRDRIEERIKNLDQRITAAGTSDPSDDPPFWDSEPRCLLCHRE